MRADPHSICHPYKGWRDLGTHRDIRHAGVCVERARVTKETAGEITPADPGPGVPPSRAVGGKHLLFKPPGHSILLWEAR